MTDLENRNLVGKSLVIVTIVYILINIGTVVVQTLVLALRRLKLILSKYKQSKKIKERRDRKLRQSEVSGART